MQARNFLKKRLQHKCFSVNINEIFNDTLITDTSDYCFWSFAVNGQIVDSDSIS